MTSLISRRPLDGFVAGRGLALLRVSAADKILNRAQIGEGWILDFPLNKLREPMPVNASNRSRSEEHTSELQSLMRISYAVFCLKKKKNTTTIRYMNNHTQH